MGRELRRALPGSEVTTGKLPGAFFLIPGEFMRMCAAGVQAECGM